MNTLLRTAPALLVLAFTAVSCGTMQTATAVRDDVYYVPGDEPLASTTPYQDREAPPAETEPAPKAVPQDDYYDPNSAAQYSGPGSYYDATYNDPYYYNYGRFGFNTGSSMTMGMGWQNGWSGPGWGMSMGYGWGTGSSSFGMGYGGLYDPFWNGGYVPGYGYGYPSYGWQQPYYNDPWMSGYGYGYGYGGPYMGPCGSCYSCYSPVVIGGGSGVVVGHRPSLNGRGSGIPGGGGSPTQTRSAFRDPVGLTRPAVEGRPYEPGRTTYERPTGGRLQPTTRPGRDPVTRPAERPSRLEPTTRPTRERSPDRGTFDRGNGGGSRETSPSRGGGGGDNSGGGGGGSRGGGGGRPR